LWHGRAQALRVAVVLHAGGAIVTGTIISGKKYFEQTRQAFKTPDDSSRIAVEAAFASFTDFYSSSDLSDEELNFIHLKNAVVRSLIGMTISVNDGGETSLWRGPLSHVDGFMLGDCRNVD